MSNNDLKAKTFVRDFLASTCGVTLREIESKPDEKSADFEMIDGSERILVAELKTLEYYPPSAATGWTMIREDEGGADGYRKYQGPARIADKIYDAYVQLSQYPHPWAVIIHNADYRINAGTFYAAFAENRVMDIDGRRLIIETARKIVLEKTRRARREIDLFIWIDQEDRQPRLVVWWQGPLGEGIGQKYFSAAAGEYKV